ncbi:MAG TPA: nuclear transport factor 2 family protein [Holophagaceae bacterium]|nr:nuclear transport factor 2 family protein [Holophagaceae bacterium]
MFPALDTLDAPARRTVRAYMDHFLDRRETGFGALFTEDGTFEGAFSGGALQGRILIEAHFRHNVRRLFLDGVVSFQGVEVKGSRVVLHWELLRSGPDGPLATAGRTVLDLAEDGLLRKVKAEWDPKALVD